MTDRDELVRRLRDRANDISDCYDDSYSLLVEAASALSAQAPQQGPTGVNVARLLNLRCPGNNDCDDPVECQSYEAHEQGAPCPPGCCVMAEEKDVRSIIAAIDDESAP